MIPRRRERVESLIMQELSLIIQRKIADPRVRGVHIVSVNISPDFHLARVYYSTLESDRDIEMVQAGLDSAKSFIRLEMKKTVKLRVSPEIAFFFDPSIRHGDHMLDLLRKLNIPKE